MPSASANRRGILAIVLAMSLFVLNDTLVKLASASHPPGQIMAVRSTFAFMLALGLVAASGHLSRLDRLLSPFLLMRALIEATVAFLFISSLAHLPLANVTAILQATPILTTIILVAFGLERVGWRIWGATLVGFLGVVLVVKPDPAGFNVFTAIALACAVLVSVRDLVTRRIGAEVPSVVVTLSTTLAVGLFGIGFGFWETWQPLAVREILALAGAAILVTVGNLAVITAFRHADVAVISPFRYSTVPLAILLGLAVFGELPDALACAGIVLIVASGFYTVHREQVRLRRLRPSSGRAST